MLWGVAFGSIAVLYIIKRFDWFKKITYFFISFQYGSKNILICDYHEGFDSIYKDYTLCYLIAKMDGILIRPIHIFGNFSKINYQKINKFTIEHQIGTSLFESLPNKIYSVNRILIDFLGEDSFDILKVRVKNAGNLNCYPFNEYSMSRSNFFAYVESIISEEKFEQEYL